MVSYMLRRQLARSAPFESWVQGTAVPPLVAILASAALAGCSTTLDSEAAHHDQGPTFHRDVEPLLQKNCQSCHSSGNIAPFSLITYEDAKAVAGLMAARTEDRTMPPWGAFETPECKPRSGWKDDKRLSKEEIDVFRAWSESGAEKGDPRDAPPATNHPRGARLADADIVLQPQKPFVTSGDEDQFRCFVLDPKLAEDRYLNATHIVAGNAKVVHHAVVYLDPTGASVEKAGPDGDYECFGGVGVDMANAIAAWAPGGLPQAYPPNAGLPIPAGAKLVLQIHYHPAGSTAEPDTTQFEARFTTSKPEYAAKIVLVGNFSAALPHGDGLLPGPGDEGEVEFRIPAGSKGHTEAMRYTVPSEGGSGQAEYKLHAIQPHMHYVGTDALVRVTRQSPGNGDPGDECLVATPQYDFNWQRRYAYDLPTIDELPTLRGGDVLDVKCTYDNSLENPFVKRALLEEMLAQPKDVTLGESTLDEMCVGLFDILVKN